MTVQLQSNFWLAQDLAAVCALQNVASPGNLTLNGSYHTPTTTTISFLAQGFVRQVSLTAATDLSAAVFTITGIQNNTVVTSIINGPMSNTVYTSDYYDIISSVAVDRPVTGISVGTGLLGFFPLLVLNTPANTAAYSLTSSVNAFALSFATQSSNGCTYQLYESLTDYTGNGETYVTLLNNSSLIPIGSPYVNLTQIIQSTNVCADILISVSSAIDTSTLNMQFLNLS